MSNHLLIVLLLTVISPQSTYFSVEPNRTNTEITCSSYSPLWMNLQAKSITKLRIVDWIMMEKGRKRGLGYCMR